MSKKTRQAAKRIQKQRLKTEDTVKEGPLERVLAGSTKSGWENMTKREDALAVWDWTRRNGYR